MHVANYMYIDIIYGCQVVRVSTVSTMNLFGATSGALLLM